MGKFSKKIKRDRSKQAEKDLVQKVNMFDHLPDSCGACSKPFDKLNREMVMSWSVVVREEKKEVNLYCPSCWQTANEIVQDFKNKVMERIENDSEKG
jgi:hypothetical protein